MIGEVFKEGIEIYKHKWLGLAGIMLVDIILSVVIMGALLGGAGIKMLLTNGALKATDQSLGVLINVALGVILVALVGLGFYGTTLVYAAEQEIDISEAFKRGFGRLPHLLAVKILGSMVVGVVAVVVGLIFSLINPFLGVLLGLIAGILVGFLFVATDYLVVVERKGVIESLMESKHAVLQNYLGVLLTAIVITITSFVAKLVVSLIPLLGIVISLLVVGPFYGSAINVAFAREVLKKVQWHVAT